MASEHLSGGLSYEHAGMSRRAIAAYEAALQAGTDPLDRAEAQMRIARAHFIDCDWESAVREARIAVRLAEEAGSADLTAEAMNVEGGVYQLRGEFDDADAIARAALNVARSPRVRGILLQNRGAIAAQRGDFTAASVFFRESMDAFEQSGYEFGMATALNNAAAAARDAGDPEHSLRVARQAADAARRLSAYETLSLAVQNQAYALVALGRTGEAEAPLGEALGHHSATANMLRQAECLEIMGILYTLKPDERDTAERCFDLARTLAERVDAGVLATRVVRRLAELRAEGEGTGDTTTDVERPLP